MRQQSLVEHLIIQLLDHNATDDNTIGNNLFASGSSLPSSSVDVPISEASATQSIQGDYVKGSRERFCHKSSENSLYI
jgi:hypothetical protein